MARRLRFTSRRRRTGRLSFRIAGFVAAAFLVVWLIGFMRFIASLPSGPPTPMPKADAIVALTGGAERLNAAMSLLNTKTADRLLITGVNVQTPREDVKDRIDDSAGRFDCCVDLDRAALNTVGNAVETRRWVYSHGYRSLIVVTAQYHMPRALRELQFAMPKIELVGYPVFPVSVAKSWYRPATLQLLISEYIKTQASIVRIWLTDMLSPKS